MARQVQNNSKRAFWAWLQCVGNWATSKQIVLLLTGKTNRIHGAETILPRLVRKGLLKRTRYHKQWVYAARRVTKGTYSDINVEHGIGCTEGLVRFWISDRSGELIPERKFKGKYIRPEWAIRFPSGKIGIDKRALDANDAGAGAFHT